MQGWMVGFLGGIASALALILGVKGYQKAVALKRTADGLLHPYPGGDGSYDGK